MDIASVGAFVREIGFPVAFILLCSYAVWRVGVFFAPIVQRIAAAHIDLVATLKDNDTKKTDVMETQAALLSQNSDRLNDIHRAVVK